MGSPDELVDEVDEHDHVLRTVTRREMRARRLRHRGVFVAVIDSQHRLVIHQRATNKDIWPGRWDIGAGGVVSAGESYELAAQRELYEELGISAHLREIGRGSYNGADVMLNGRVFVAQHDGPYVFNDGEVVAIELIPMDDITALLPLRSWCPDSIEMAWPILNAWYETHRHHRDEPPTATIRR
jgi:8-oxo-dGTP pyrophosphatase MutT (NUDIX family)